MTTMMTDVYSLRAVTTAGALAEPLGEDAGKSVSCVLNDIGAIELSYPVGAANSLSAVLGREVAVLRNGTELPNCRFFLEDKANDLISEDGEASIVSLSGRSFASALDDAIVYPQAWPQFDPPNQAFTNATPGTIMSTLISKAKLRGTSMRNLTYTFNANQDSNGQPWTKVISLAYDAGVKLTDALLNLVAQGMCDFETVGRELRLYNPGTLERRLDTGSNAVAFRRGRDMKDAPEKVTLRDVGTVGLIGGKDNVYYEYVDAAAVNTHGRRERWFSQGGIADTTTLNTVVQYEIMQVNRPKLERTHGIVPNDPNAPQPYLDFQLGDWVISDTASGVMESYRIRQINLSFNDQGMLEEGQVVLNDLFSEFNASLSKRVNGIINGTTITGTSNGTSNPTDDTMPPNPPTSVSFSSVVDLDLGRAQITATWTKPTQNANGTAYDDHSHYEFQWRYFSSADWPNGTLEAQQESITFGPLEQNRAVTVRVRAVDSNGNRSTWAEYTGATAIDTTPPPAPSQPTVVGDLGYLMVKWDGLGFAGQGMPADTRYVEVHSSQANNFTPVAPGAGTTMVDRMAVGQAGVLIPGSYTATTYVKLVAVDAKGNRSTASAQASGIAAPVLEADVFDGAIGTAKLKDAAIVTAKIADATITDAKIATLSVAKLTAGTMNAAVILAGSISTAASGARVTMTSAGLRMYDAGGAEKVSILNNGNATFSGYLQAAQILGTVSAIDSATGMRVDITPGGSFARPSVVMSTGAQIEKSPAGWTMGTNSFLRLLITYIYGPGTGLITGSGGQLNTSTIFQLETEPVDGDFANATTLPTRVAGRAKVIMPVPRINDNGTYRNQPVITFESDVYAGGMDDNHGRYPGIVFENIHQAQVALRTGYLSGTDSATFGIVCEAPNGGARRPFWCSSVNPTSGRATKRDIGEIGWSALEVIKSNPSQRWRFKTEEQFSVGPMADELPAELRREMEGTVSYDVTSAIGTLWKAIEEIMERLDDKR